MMVQVTSHCHLRGRSWHNDVVCCGRVALCGILQEIRCWLTNGSRGVNTLTMPARRGPIDLLRLGGITTFSHKWHS